ncbi:MAG: ribonuclease P protein subunit [Methanoregulaceae archaeon]|jgi:ribonuclease P protein subunit POP4|nr:ribonuclease P protein subunit [Methanoregulaceae archaeon]
MISVRNILRHELLGLEVLVITASNPLHGGIGGRIIDETKHTLLIRTSDGKRRIPKMRSVFRLTLDNGLKIDVDGSALTGSPERRITLHMKK